MEKKRRQTNIQLRRLCKQKNVYFLETWKAMEDKTKKDRSINLDLYANDGLHLNNDGISALGNYIEGTTACLLDFKKMPKPKRWKRKFGLPTQAKN
jgi:lysophospholipase L1-like esterase